MRQLLIFILIFFYSLTATSATVYFHFCHGEAQSVSFINDKNEHHSCKFCEQKEKSCHQEQDQKDTCQDLEIDLKNVDHNHFSSDSAKVNPTISPAILVKDWIPSNNLFFEKTAAQYYPIELPYFTYQDISPYLKNCNFRI